MNIPAGIGPPLSTRGTTLAGMGPQNVSSYESIDVVPELPEADGDVVTYQSHGVAVLIGWAGPARWILQTHPSDDREGHLTFDGMWTILVSGNPTGAARNLDTWREAVRIFF